MAQPLLARDVVRYVGEPVAVVVTENRYQGEDAADLVDVEYDVLPVVVDMAAARDDGAPVLFPAAGSNVAASFGDPASFAAGLFDGCDVVVSRTIANQRVAPAPMEGRAAAASWADGRLTAWIPNQGAQGTRGSLAEMLGIDQADIRVITPDVGGAFGARFGADPEHAMVCWVARALDRPARWTEHRNENLLGMTHGRARSCRS
jgi:carbon-monoxide dehydrogenase large subunit